MTLQCHELIDILYLAMNKNARPNTLTIMASTGVKQLKQNESIRSAIKRADKVLHQAKDNGRN